MRGLIESIAQFHAGRGCDKFFFDFIVSLADKKQIIGTQTALARHAVTAPQQPIDNRIHITVRHNYHVVLSITVNRCLFAQLAGQCEKLPAHGCGANEAHTFNQRMGQYLLVHIAAAVNEVHQSRWKSFNLIGDSEYGIQTHRIIFTGADDNRTAAGNRIWHKRRPGVHRDIVGGNN